MGHLHGNMKNLTTFEDNTKDKENIYKKGTKRKKR
jgi:hypothetical protein